MDFTKFIKIHQIQNHKSKNYKKGLALQIYFLSKIERMDFSKLPPGGSININFEEYNEEASNQKNKKQNLQSSHNQDQVARFEG